uniref:Uncharacterized protein n=1 Tax=Picea glauca TaxID=3330 RepID=A0A101LYS3_PICGL|nr:hypothetical protein ABT39_MTgene4769 [Picea glauca]
MRKGFLYACRVLKMLARINHSTEEVYAKVCCLLVCLSFRK